MSWRESPIRFQPRPELTHDWMLRYLALRKRGLIGMLWVEQGSCCIAPLGLNLRAAAEPIRADRLMAQIAFIEAEPVRKGPQSETGKGRSAECAA